MEDQPSSPSFAQLDELLDQALALDEQEREDFVAGLDSIVRERVVELLELSNALTMSELASQAARTVETMAARSMSLDTKAGRWHLQRELGSGGMGQVFYATRQEPDSGAADSGYLQQAAVKVLWSHRANDESMARFFRERRILAALDHPGLARFLDGGFLADGRPWFAMEFVDGVDVIEHVKPLSIRKRLVLFKEICAAVGYAHERLIVHRDIKPQNILVDATGRARLLDFGVASILDDAAPDLHTRTQGSPLTLMYASPEQVQGEIVTVASDIYQLGLLLYQMLTDKTALDVGDGSLQAALHIINERLPIKPSTHRAEIEPDLDAIVLTALRKDPSRRYRSAMALAADIQYLMDGKPVQAVPSSRWYVARRFVRRNALVVTIATAAVLGLTVATIVSLRMANEATAQAERSKASQQILTDVFRKADPFADGGAGITLADALLRAQPGIEQRVADDPLLAWEVNATLGKIYEDLGLVDHEADAWTAVLQAARLLKDSDHRRELVGIAGYGSTLARGNPAEAVTYFTTNLPAEPPSAAAVQPWLDAQYAYIGALGRFRKFTEADAQTLRLASVIERYDVTSGRTLGRLNQQLAGVARRAGDTSAELQHWREAVAHMRQVQAPAALAITLSNSAIALGRAGRYAESRLAFREAIEIYQAAGHQDDSLAGILRGYGGLLFRMGDRRAAIDTTQQALALLDPQTQVYAWFLSQINLAHYTFAIGDTTSTLTVVLDALPVVQAEFSDDGNIPQRILGVFAKLLLFSGNELLAARALGITECPSPSRWFAELDLLEPTAERDVRRNLWQALSNITQSASDIAPEQSQVDALLNLYTTQTPPFFDVMDRWRVHEGLAVVGNAYPLSDKLVAERAELQRLRIETNQQLSAIGLSRIEVLVDYFAGVVVPGSPCGE